MLKEPSEQDWTRLRQTDGEQGRVKEGPKGSLCYSEYSLQLTFISQKGVAGEITRWYPGKTECEASQDEYGYQGCYSYRQSCCFQTLEYMPSSCSEKCGSAQR